jgi:hypothetical protein
MKNLMGDFNTKAGRENIFKQINGIQSLHEANNDNGVREVNFATSKTLIVKSTFPHCNIHKHTWTSSDGITHNQIDHVLIDKRRQSNILLEVRSFRGADCDTDHYLVVAKLKERISVSKRARQNSDLERFDLKKLKDVEVKEKYQVETSNRFAALESLDESFGKVLEKKAKSQMLQNPSQINGDNLKNLICETSRTFRNKKREYLKGKINELETNNKNKNIRDFYRGINEFRKGYQPKINIIKDDNGNLLADPQNVLNKWKNFFNQVLNVHGVHEVTQMDTHMAEGRLKKL